MKQFKLLLLYTAGLLLLAAALTTLTGCSETQTYHRSRGVCIEREVHRVFGVPILTEEAAADSYDVTENCK